MSANSNQFTTTGFSYDASGNVLADGTNTYAWNAESEIKTAPGVNYTYDGDGDRVEKSNGKLYWYGVGSDALMETDLSGNLTYEYVFFGGKRIARRDSSGNVVYYVGDHLGTSRVVTNSTGAILDQSDFYPFGGERVITASSGNTYKFTGKERDSESGLDNFGARYNSSALGRFLSPDWSAVPEPVPYANLSNPQTLNLYAMVSDNPETFADLNGHYLMAPAEYGGNVSLTGPGDFGNASPSRVNNVSELGDGYYAYQNLVDSSSQAQNTSQTQTETQTQPKHLSAEDVSKAIQSVKQDTGPNAKKAVDFLNSLGMNWILSGDILRQAVKDSKVDAFGADKNVDSVKRSGDKVTVQLNKGLSFFEIYKTKTTISFDIGDVKGRPALLNIQGVEVFHGYHYVPKTDYGPN